MSIGSRLKKLRISYDLTLEQVGKKIGSSKQTLYKYENGIVTNIPSDKIESLAKVYATTPSYLMGWEDECGEKLKIMSPHDSKLLALYNQAKTSNDPKERAIAFSIDKLLNIDSDAPS